MRVPGSRAATGFVAAAAAVALMLSGAWGQSPAEAAPVLSTAFPGIQVQPGKSVDFPLTVRESGAQPEIVSLAVKGVPHGWTAVLKGISDVVDEAYVRPGTGHSRSLDLQVKVPAKTPVGTYRLRVAASGPSGTSVLPLAVRVASVRAAKPTLTAKYPQLQGPNSAKFQFQLTLSNNGFSSESFALSARVPSGWQVDFTPGFSQKHIVSLPVKSGASQTVDVNLTPASNASTGAYPIGVTATAGPGQTASTRLDVHLTGTYKLQVTTPSGRLDATAVAGRQSQVPVVVVNGGSASLHAVSLTASAPSHWTVKFKPSHITNLAPGAVRQVTMEVRPGSRAISGDYDVTATASAPQTSASQDLRVTVDTSTLWGWVGVLIVVAVLAGLGVLFRRLGRR